MSRRPVQRGVPGFTLLELMVVVMILAILSAIALAAFSRMSRRVRVSEAYRLLGVIRAKQVSYYSEYSQFCDVSSSSHDGNSGAPTAQWPMSPPGMTAADWYTGLPAEWALLGVRPDGPVFYRYDTVGGNPGIVPGFGGGLNYQTVPEQPAWWAAHAYGDLDGNGQRSTFEAFSLSTGVWVSGVETE